MVEAQATDRHLARYDEPRRLANGGKWVLWADASDLLADKNAEIERMDARVKWLEQYNAATESTLTREKTKRQQAEHERDCAVEDVVRLRDQLADCETSLRIYSEDSEYFLKYSAPDVSLPQEAK